MSSMGFKLRCCRLKTLSVSGFKSLRNTKLDFSSGLTILVGANGSGKTALIESLLLLRDMLDYLRGRVANPFLRWWGYRNVVWMHDETIPIKISVAIDCSGCSADEVERYLEERLGARIARPEAERLLGVTRYTITVSGAGGEFRIVRDELCVGDFACLSLTPPVLVLRLREHDRAVIADYYARGAVRAILGKVISQSGRVETNGTKLGELYAKLKGCMEAYGKLLDDTAKLLGEVKAEAQLQSLLELLPTQPRSVGRSPEPSLIDTTVIIANLIGLTGLVQVFERTASSVAERLTENNSRELGMLVDCIARLCYEAGLEACSGITARELAYKAALSAIEAFTAALVGALHVVGSFIDNIVVLRPLNHQALRTPHVLEKVERLREDAANLLPVLFQLGRGRLPEDIAVVLEDVLNAESVSGFFEATPDGRVVLKLVVGNVELAQPSIPEGVWKAIAIMAAVLSEPSLVAIDEFENSLHASAQELLLNELRENVPSVIIATHSPVVVDTAKSLSEIAVVELEAGETRIKRVAAPERLAEKLRELGVAPSEALLYGLLDTAPSNR